MTPRLPRQDAASLASWGSSGEMNVTRLCTQPLACLTLRNPPKLCSCTFGKLDSAEPLRDTKNGGEVAPSSLIQRRAMRIARGRYLSDTERLRDEGRLGESILLANEAPAGDFGNDPRASLRAEKGWFMSLRHSKNQAGGKDGEVSKVCACWVDDKKPGQRASTRLYLFHWILHYLSLFPKHLSCWDYLFMQTIAPSHEMVCLWCPCCLSLNLSPLLFLHPIHVCPLAKNCVDQLK